MSAQQPVLTAPWTGAPYSHPQGYQSSAANPNFQSYAPPQGHHTFFVAGPTGLDATAHPAHQANQMTGSQPASSGAPLSAPVRGTGYITVHDNTIHMTIGLSICLHVDIGYGFWVYHQEYRITFTESSFGTGAWERGMISSTGSSPSAAVDI